LLKRCKHERDLERLSGDWDRAGVNAATIGLTRTRSSARAGVHERSLAKRKRVSPGAAISEC
jgi:hypothetical protein